MTATDERRRFTRFAFDARAQLKRAGETLEVQLEDIALRGFLIREPENAPIEDNERVCLEVHLAGDEVVLRLPARLVWRQPPWLGFACEELELETLSHLRRLAELNLGDETLLDRELEQLVGDPARG